MTILDPTAVDLRFQQLSGLTILDLYTAVDCLPHPPVGDELAWATSESLIHYLLAHEFGEEALEVIREAL